MRDSLIGTRESKKSEIEHRRTPSTLIRGRDFGKYEVFQRYYIPEYRIREVVEKSFKASRKWHRKYYLVQIMRIMCFEKMKIRTGETPIPPLKR